MKRKPYRIRPALPWYHEIPDNEFNSFRTPAEVFAYVASQLPELVPELIECVIDAGAGGESLMRDIVELAEMGHDNLGEQIYEAAKPENDLPSRGKSISEMDFLPEGLEGANEILLKAAATIIAMKVMERCEGVPIQERVEPGYTERMASLRKEYEIQANG